MVEKIKAFFQKKPVVITEGVVIAVAAAGLFVGGFDVIETVTGKAQIGVAIVTGIEALVTLIQGLFKAKE